MLKGLIFILSACVSLLLFDFLFYKLSCSSLHFFGSIQRKLNLLSEDRQKRFKIFTFIIVVLFYMLLQVRAISVFDGLLLGFLFSIRNVCFKETFLDVIKNSKSQWFRVKIHLAEWNYHFYLLGVFFCLN